MKRGRKTRAKLDKPFCVIGENSVSRTWFATEAEAIAHAATLDAKRAEWERAKYGASDPQTTKLFAIVRVTAKVGPKPPVEPPVIVSYYR